MKIQVARGRNAHQCHQGLLEACGNDALPYRTVARWVSAFHSGRDESAHLARTGGPSISDEHVELVRGLLAVGRCWTVRELFIDVGLSHQTVWHILKNKFHMRKAAARWVPHNLTEAQKWHRYAVAGLHLERYHNEGDTFLQRIVAIDETWTRAYEPELKRQSNEWRNQGSPRPKRVRCEPSRVKVTLIVAYDSEGVIISHAVPAGQNVNAAYYQHFLEHTLRPAMRRKRLHFLRDNPPCVRHDNVRCHVARAVSDLLQRWHWEVLDHFLCSPDMTTTCSHGWKNHSEAPCFKILHQYSVQ
jgi:hypothetical protein